MKKNKQNRSNTGLVQKDSEPQQRSNVLAEHAKIHEERNEARERVGAVQNGIRRPNLEGKRDWQNRKTFDTRFTFCGWGEYELKHI